MTFDGAQQGGEWARTRPSQGALQFAHAEKRPPEPEAGEQLVFPFQLRMGDDVLDDGARLEVVGRPTGMRGGKATQ
jgi:hypothetical protein